MALVNNRAKSLTFKEVAVETINSPTDLTSLLLPEFVTRWIPTRILFKSLTAIDLTSAVIDLRTSASGGGISLLSSPLTLTAFNGSIDLIDSASLATFSSALGDTTIYIHQTVNSNNIGNIMIIVEYLDLS